MLQERNTECSNDFSTRTVDCLVIFFHDLRIFLFFWFLTCCILVSCSDFRELKWETQVWKAVIMRFWARVRRIWFRISLWDSIWSQVNSFMIPNAFFYFSSLKHHQNSTLKFLQFLISEFLGFHPQVHHFWGDFPPMDESFSNFLKHSQKSEFHSSFFLKNQFHIFFLLK